ncbi:MAG: bifunctional phosphopantothenoylcysteine decarboxylase/phosphopantothenate--cysteine ligase CoaBC [Tissierellia bacterium]|nr:bifunctional phosphopantothenoylcysteine decarboxylase/phosphopantothenate--cysteine ligase CoaBC [Tissierellia bacterium]
MNKKKILLGITGGIALYKVLELCSRLVKKDYDLRIIMTENAKEFVSPLTFETMGRTKVYSEMFHKGHHDLVEHIELVKDIDAFIIAPATANFIGKAANGIADDLLSSAFLAYNGSVLFAPGMNDNMLSHPATQKNIEQLKEWGHEFIEAQIGRLACNTVGKGRMAEPEDIVPVLEKKMTVKDLRHKKIIVTAGPTVERIDPVRYLTNDSSGKMGYAIAEQAWKRGADVLLISGPTSLKSHWPTEYIHSTNELMRKIDEYFDDADALIMAAAPSDYRPKVRYDQKIKKKDQDLILELEENPDILMYFAGKKSHQKLIGFAAETENLMENARIKKEKKSLDYIIANDITQKGAGFNVDTNICTIIGDDVEKLDLMSKKDLADRILDLL